MKIAVITEDGKTISKHFGRAILHDSYYREWQNRKKGATQ